jgi:hypothetical protein
MIGPSDALDSERVSVYCRVSETLSEIFGCPLSLSLFEVQSWKGKVRGLPSKVGLACHVNEWL